MSLFSDSEGSNSSVDQSMVFGSTRVQPNSPTPYTDATQTKKNSPDHIKRPMNAFMVFSHHERKKVIAEEPNIHNTYISKELGKRWKELNPEEREPYIQEAENLKQMHSKQFPEYKYRPSKKKTRMKLVLEENREVREKCTQGPIRFASSMLNCSSTSYPSLLKDRIKITSGQRDVLKSINPNKFSTRLTINRQFKVASRCGRKGAVGTSLGASEGAWEPSPPSKVPASPRSAWPTTPDPHSSPFYKDSAVVQLQYSPPSPSCPRTVPMSPLTTRSCPQTPLYRSSSLLAPLPPQALTRPPSPLFTPSDSHCWDLDSASLPDLSSCLKDIFPQASTSSDLFLEVGDLMLETSSAPSLPPTSLPTFSQAVLEDQDMEGIDLDRGLMEYIH